MRTHVDLAPTRIRALRELATRRGYRGYSRLVAEAVEEYLARHGREVEEDRAAKMARLCGSLSNHEAAEMRRVVTEIRGEKA